MGQKIHPYGLRLGIVTDWKSRWYSEKDYAAQVNEDQKIRKYLRDELTRGAVSRIDIERIGDKKVQIDIHTGRPGVVIGRGGSEAERLRSGLEDLSGRNVKFNVIEVANPELDAQLLARSVADQLEGRVAFRRAMKRTVTTAMKAGAEGVRVQAQGRLGGADMGRREWYLEGRVPLHTLRADIDYGVATARTSVGAVGIKVWVYRGDLLTSVTARNEKIAAEARLAAGGPAQRRRRSARSRAEAAAGESGGKRLIEAGGGKRPVEPGAGKKGGKRLIEAGGGRRKPTTSDAAAEFEEAKKVTEEAVEDAAVVTDAAAIVADEAAVEAIETAVVAEAVAEEAEVEAVIAEVAVEEAIVAETVAEETGTEEAIVEAVVAEEIAEDAVAEAVVAEAVAEVAEEIAEVADEDAVEAVEAAIEESDQRPATSVEQEAGSSKLEAGSSDEAPEQSEGDES
ncbi:MAG: 30S ribosomal protein S3 [Actinomycetia bacterium]|nr:30S ribosomal protein S3 [Actinomycetes bacterium]